jgi:hypothetical protein
MRRPRSARASDPPIWLARLRWKVRGDSARLAVAGAIAVGCAAFAVLPPAGSPGLTGLRFLLVVGAVVAVGLVGGGIGSKLLRRRDPSLPRMVARDRAATLTLVVGTVALLVGGLLHRPAVVAEQERYDGLVAAGKRLAARRAPAYAVARRDEADVRRLSTDVLRVCFPVGRPDRAWCAIVRRDGATPRARTDSDPRPNDVVAAETDDAP